MPTMSHKRNSHHHHHHHYHHPHHNTHHYLHHQYQENTLRPSRDTFYGTGVSPNRRAAHLPTTTDNPPPRSGKTPNDKTDDAYKNFCHPTVNSIKLKYNQEPFNGPSRFQYQSPLNSNTRRMPRLLPTISETGNNTSLLAVDLDFPQQQEEKKQSQWASILERRRVANRSSCYNNNYVAYYASRRPPKLTLSNQQHHYNIADRPPSPVPSLSPCDSPDNTILPTTGYWLHSSLTTTNSSTTPPLSSSSSPSPSSSSSPHYLLPSPPTSPYITYSPPPPGEAPVVYSPTKSFKQRSSDWLDTIMEDES